MSTAGTRPRFVDVVADAGITYRQADYWCRRGWLHTRYLDRAEQTPLDKGGSGFDRYIEDDEIEVLRIMARLVKAGFTPEAAAKLARNHSRLTAAVVRALERLQQAP